MPLSFISFIMAAMEIKPSSARPKPAYPLFAAVAAAALFSACEQPAPAPNGGEDDIQALGGDVCAPAPGTEE